MIPHNQPIKNKIHLLFENFVVHASIIIENYYIKQKYVQVIIFAKYVFCYFWVIYFLFLGILYVMA